MSTITTLKDLEKKNTKYIDYSIIIKAAETYKTEIERLTLKNRELLRQDGKNQYGLRLYEKTIKENYITIKSLKSELEKLNGQVPVTKQVESVLKPVNIKTLKTEFNLTEDDAKEFHKYFMDKMDKLKF